MTEPTKLADLVAGDIVRVSGLTCLPDGARAVVDVNEAGVLAIECKDGMHCLDGQLDFDGNGTLVGIEKVSPKRTDPVAVPSDK